MVRIRFVSFVVCCALVGQSAAADPAASPLYPADNLQGTTSVMVRHSGAATTDPAMASVTAAPPRMVDKNVQPASATDPLGAMAAADPSKAAGDAVDVASAAASLAATDLLNHSLESPKNSPLPGHTLTLLASISPFGANRTNQLFIARAYWKLSAAEGDYNWAVEEADQLDHITTGAAAMDAAVLATARASTQARLLEAKLGAVTAQQELADLLGIPPNNPLPLASDPPLVGAYRTYFETLYASRLPPTRLRLIDRTLPIRREAIETHVAAVQAAASAVHSAEDARAKGQADLQNVLLCDAELSRQRRSFLAAVRDYNLDIDEYALTVADPNVPMDRVISMLIRLKPAAPTVAPPASSIIAPATSDPTVVHPTAPDPLLQPALAPGSRPSPATGPSVGPPAGPAAGPGGLGNPPLPSSGTTPTGPVSPTTTQAAPPAAPPNAPSGATGAVDPRAPVNPATVENPFAAPITPSGPTTTSGPTTPAAPH
jgi:hypothetical protein